MLLAAFVLPVALMFLITGGLYTWGFKGSYQTEQHSISLASPLAADLTAMLALASAELDRLGIDQPTGSAGVKRGGTSYKMEWTGANRDVVLEPTADPGVAILSVKDTTPYRRLVQLHKAKGGTVFKVYAAALAIALFLILASGFLMAWQVPKYRQQAMIVAGIGVISFVVALATS